MAKAAISAAAAGLGIAARAAGTARPSPPTPARSSAAPGAPHIVLGGSRAHPPLPPTACLLHVPGRITCLQPAQATRAAPPAQRGTARPPRGRTRPEVPVVQAVAMSQAVTLAGGQARPWGPEGRGW